MTDTQGIVIRRLAPELLDDLLAFFHERAFRDNPAWAGCYCWFPHHDPAGEAWDDRTAGQNRAAMAQAIRDGRASGFLAYSGEQVVGWCNAAPRDRYPTLAGLPGDAASSGVTPCFIVDPEWRGRGIGRRLLASAIEGLAADGMTRLQAGPIRDATTPAGRHRGTVGLFEAAGYERLADLPDGTVLMEKRLG